MWLRSYWAVGAMGLQLCLNMALQAQVYELSGGTSTMYRAQGATVLIHGEHMESAIGGGLENGRLAFGGSTVRYIQGGSMAIGEQGFSMELPTDVFEISHILFGVGVGLHREEGKTPTLNLFAGLSSLEGGTPLFQSSSLGKPTVFGQWRRPIGEHCNALSTGLFSTQQTALESIQCSHSQALTYAWTAGIGNGAPYAAASITVKQRRLRLRASYIFAGEHFQRDGNLNQPTPEPVRENISADYRVTSSITISGIHQNYLTPVASGTESESLPEEPQRSSLDEASIQWIHGKTGLHATLLHSSSQQQDDTTGTEYTAGNVSLSAGFTHSFGRVEWTEELMDDLQAGGGGYATLVNGVQVEVNPHLRLTESANVDGDGVTFSHGGSFVTSFSSLSVGYELLYLANRPSQPFQETMVFDAQLRLLRNLWLHAGSSVGPTGTVLYSFQLGTQLTRDAVASQNVVGDGLGANTLRGRVVDPSGVPIEGAALLIGTEHLYSDTAGYFFFREKKAKAHPFSVLLTDFLGMGQFKVVSAPKEIRTSLDGESNVLLVVVDRIAGEDIRPASPLASHGDTQMTEPGRQP